MIVNDRASAIFLLAGAKSVRTSQKALEALISTLEGGGPLLYSVPINEGHSAQGVVQRVRLAQVY